MAKCKCEFDIGFAGSDEESHHFDFEMVLGDTYRESIGALLNLDGKGVHVPVYAL
jgi:hypothetical protein